MLERSSDKCCCNSCIFFIYLVITLPIALIECIPRLNWRINEIESILLYRDYEDHPNIQKIFEQCSNLIKNKYNFPFDLSFHFYLYPSFRLTSVAFSYRFIVLKKDKLLYIITEISSMLIKMLIILDMFVLEIKIRSMPKIDMKSEEIKTITFYEKYEQFRTSFQFKKILFICTLFLIFEILLFLLVMFINREYKIKDEVKKNKYQSIILYSFFGFTLFIMINLNGKKCYNSYHYNFFPDSYRENKSFTNTNNSIRRYNPYTDSYFDEYETIYIIYEYNYTDYPILKEIYEIYYPNDEKKIYEDNTTIYESNIYNIFRFWLLSFVTFFAYCFLFFYKCKDKCKIVFIFLEICSLIIKLITILLTYIITKGYAKKQNLKTEFKEIEYIIDDYNEYAKCVNQCRVTLLEILFVIIEIFVFFYSLNNCFNSIINRIFKNNSNNNEDEISIINEKKKFDRCNLCQREAKIISDCGCKFCNRHKINDECPICKKKINKKTNIEFKCGICLEEKKQLKHFNCNCAFLICENCYKPTIENQNQNERKCPGCRQLIS